ncbi:hypothetical protein F4801DRAFT_437947 [Xylaria longipes]|nr:hypothetical protein F4801DRAFT_437947 [Xylaria longipes]
MAETAPSIPDQHPAPAHASASASTPASASPAASHAKSSLSPLPRVTIRFCTQCKWMLRAAYFAQELLSTFSTSLGEVALQPATGGIFVVEIFYGHPATAAQAVPNLTIQRRVLWDRKVDGGFPETKELKRRVRDVIEPDRNLGHVDRDYPKQQQPQNDEESTRQPNALERDATPEVEQQQQQRQALGPRWSQLDKSESSQPEVQGQQTIPDISHTGSQSKAPRDLNVSQYPQHKTIDAVGPVHDPRTTPGGGIIPVVPPVAHDSGFNIQDPPSQAPLLTQKTREECEDCQ